MENIEVKNSQLAAELAGLNLSLGGRLARGENISLSEAHSEEYLTLIKNEMEVLEQAFDDSKKVLLKVLMKEKLTKEKEDELIRLRMEKVRIREDLKAELKEAFEEQKDQIIMDARNELTL